jgi:seryl-tRNA synthetase
VQQPLSSEDETSGGQATYRAHIDFRFLKSNLDMVRQNVRKRNSSADVDAVVGLYDEWVALLERLDRLRAERNANAKAAQVLLATLLASSRRKRWR